MKNLLLLFACLLMASCNNSNATAEQLPPKEGYTNVTPEEFKKLMAKPNTVILDVRTPEETARGVIKGAVQLDFQSADFSSKLDELDNSKTYLVYCHAGGRSSSTCKLMKEKGFKKLYNLDSGYVGWE